MKKLIIMIMILSLILPGILAAITKIYPSDDAFVRNKTVSTNYNSDSWRSNLRAGYESSFGKDESYLKFSLTNFTGKNISLATFSIFHLGSHDAPVLKLYLTSNSWNEGTITWNNKPINTTLIGTSAVSGGRINFNVLPSQLTESEVSFALIENGGDGFFNSYSKDLNTGNLTGDSSYWPYLEVTYDDGGMICNTDADTDCNGCVGLTEYNDFKYGYKNGLLPGVTLPEYNDVKYGYKNGLISC